MKMKKIFSLSLAGLALLLVLGAAGCSRVPQADIPNYDGLAKYLTSEGYKFYGAYWCGACQSQKKLFGDSAQHLNYIECYDDGGTTQNEVCNKADIEAYPTWEFPDGTKTAHVFTPQELSDMSGYAKAVPTTE